MIKHCIFKALQNYAVSFVNITLNNKINPENI